MKLDKHTLAQIIKEELTDMMREGRPPSSRRPSLAPTKAAVRTGTGTGTDTDVPTSTTTGETPEQRRQRRERARKKASEAARQLARVEDSWGRPDPDDPVDPNDPYYKPPTPASFYPNLEEDNSTKLTKEAIDDDRETYMTFIDTLMRTLMDPPSNMSRDEAQEVAEKAWIAQREHSRGKPARQAAAKAKKAKEKEERLNDLRKRFKAAGLEEKRTSGLDKAPVKEEEVNESKTAKPQMKETNLFMTRDKLAEMIREEMARTMRRNKENA